MTRWIAAALVLLLAVTAHAQMTIVKNGLPNAAIVVAADANDNVKLAVNDLQTYIRKMSGANLPIVNESAVPSGNVIFVGKSKPASSMGISIPSGLTSARREEGFIEAVKGNRILLAGNEVEPYHGTEYAVYDFLNRLGVRWYMPGEFGEVVPHKSTITVPSIQVTEKPDFIQRNWWINAPEQIKRDEEQWKIRNKMNPEPMFQIPSDSSVQDYLSVWENFNKHPEYFAEDSRGNRQKGLPNLNNPEAIKVVADHVKEYLRNHPGRSSCGFAPDDGFPRDYSDEAKAQNQGFVEIGGRQGVPGELSTSEEWFTFVNKVIDEVHKEFPDAYIATNGYANRDFPPQGIKVNDHMVLMFAAIWSCTLHGYDDPHCWQKVRQGQMIKKWAQMCPNVWIYGYIDNMLVSAITPLPEVGKLSRDMPFLKKAGVIGFWDEARSAWAEPGIISRYLRARLEWNADAAVQPILSDFYFNWYGAAAKPMAAFYDYLEKAVQNTPIHGHEDRVMPEVYTPELMSALAKQIVLAEKLADTDTVKLHVKVDRLIYEHLKSYVGMTQAEWNGDFTGAAKQAERMLDLRKRLNAISPHLMPAAESQYAYWGVPARRDFYRKLADMTNDKTGQLVALLPKTAMFRTDPHEDGVFEEWYKSQLVETPGWKQVLTAKPFYLQGYMDTQGHPYSGYMWYRLKVNVPASAKGKKVNLYAAAVESEPWVWVNGQYIGHRKYQDAYERPAEMEFDVTQAIKPGQTNTITIRVSTGLAPAQAASGLLSRLFLYSPVD